MRNAFLLVLLAGCSAVVTPNVVDGGGTEACAEYVVPAGTDLTKPTVSFATDVKPILEKSCGLSSSCHGTNRKPLLAASTDAKTMRAGLFGTTPLLSTSVYVKPGDAKGSFLQRKIDGDQCKLDAQCTGKTCGESMPLGSELLLVAQRDTIRRWIQQGALEN